MPARRTCPWCRRTRWIPRAYDPYCTRTCARFAKVTVTCCVCGQIHDPLHLSVLYRSADGKWWCTDEKACHRRAGAAPLSAADKAAMYRALESVWAELEANGWRL